jgi:uncharacterized protein YecE (DUF72 family)
MPRVFIGTSGFSYKHWGNGVFYPKGLPQSEWFNFYASYFNTVEINSTFYRLPKVEVFESWYRKAPQDFIFVLKGNRFMTHIKKFKDPKDSWDLFHQRAQVLKEKLGPILFQTPPSWKKDLRRLEGFLEIIPENLRLVFEFRHPSWFEGEVYKILRKHNNTCLCFVSSPNWPTAEVVTSDFIYVRLHGEERLYSSTYSDKQLKSWAQKFKKWLGEGKDVYAYFNNDALGYGPENAKKLRQFLRRARD